MINLLNKKLCSKTSLKAQNKVQWGDLYFLTTLKVNNFLHEIKWIGVFYPFFGV